MDYSRFGMNHNPLVTGFCLCVSGCGSDTCRRESVLSPNSITTICSKLPAIASLLVGAFFVLGVDDPIGLLLLVTSVRVLESCICRQVLLFLVGFCGFALLLVHAAIPVTKPFGTENRAGRFESIRM
jgi:hypothetical protein